MSFALILRPLIINTIDPVFHESQSRRPGLVTHWFMFLVVLNLLGAFKALGTLMAVGLMTPAGDGGTFTGSRRSPAI